MKETRNRGKGKGEEKRRDARKPTKQSNNGRGSRGIKKHIMFEGANLAQGEKYLNRTTRKFRTMHQEAFMTYANEEAEY